MSVFRQLLRTSPAPISAFLLVVGFIMMASGYLPLGVVGAAWIFLAFLVPFLRLSFLSANEPMDDHGAGGAAAGKARNPGSSRNESAVPRTGEGSRAVNSRRKPPRQGRVSADS
jgi:hypothetical protein